MGRSGQQEYIWCRHTQRGAILNNRCDMGLSVWKFRVFSTNCQRITMNWGEDNSKLHRH